MVFSPVRVGYLEATDEERHVGDDDLAGGFGLELLGEFDAQVLRPCVYTERETERLRER